MDSLAVALVTISTIVVFLGFVAGLIGTRYPKAPWIATTAIILSYFALLAVTVAWAVDCPGCYRGEETRAQLVGIAAWLSFGPMLGLIGIVWFGRLASLTFESLLWWRRA